jgi:hypothetical protein
MYRGIVFWFVVITFLITGTYAFGHATHHPQFHELTDEEVRWIRVQRNRVGQWCCAPHNIQLVRGAEVRTQGSETQVFIRDVNQWVPVPPEKRMVWTPGNPFGMEALVFFSTQRRDDGTISITIYCLGLGGGT